jgi:hypothetical protein
MADTITFRGATVRHFDVRQSPKGEGMWVNIHMSADFTDTLREAMDWEDLPESYKDADLSGDLAGVEMYLKPNGKELDQYALKLYIKTVDRFKVVSLKQSEDDPDERELRFTITTNAKKAHVYLGSWVQYIGTGKGVLKVSYSAQGELEEQVIDKQQALDTTKDD